MRKTLVIKRYKGTFGGRVGSKGTLLPLIWHRSCYPGSCWLSSPPRWAHSLTIPAELGAHQLPQKTTRQTYWYFYFHFQPKISGIPGQTPLHSTWYLHAHKGPLDVTFPNLPLTPSHQDTPWHSHLSSSCWCQKAVLQSGWTSDLGLESLDFQYPAPCPSVYRTLSQWLLFSALVPSSVRWDHGAYHRVVAKIQWDSLCKPFTAVLFM